MFTVYDSGKSANNKGFPQLKNKGWVQNSFSTLNEAIDYARNWLGEYAAICPTEPNKPVDYSGYGDMIEIRSEVDPDNQQLQITVSKSPWPKCDRCWRRVEGTVLRPMLHYRPLCDRCADILADIPGTGDLERIKLQKQVLEEIAPLTFMDLNETEQLEIGERIWHS